MAVFIDSLKKSIKTIKGLRQWKILSVIAALDLLFVILYGALSFFYNSMSYPFMNNIVAEAGKLGSDISAALGMGNSALSVLMSNPVIMNNLGSYLVVSLLFVVLLYLLWILIQALSWHFADKMIVKNAKYRDYFPKFSKISLIWFLIFIAVFSVTSFLSLIILLKPEQIMTSSVLTRITDIIEYVLIYFALISISLIPAEKNMRKTLKLGIVNILNFAAVYIIIIAALLINFEVTYWITKPIVSGMTSINVLLFAVTFLRFIIAAPFLCWGRIYLIETVKKLSTK